MRIAIINPITQTSPDRWSVPAVQSNRQCIAMQLGRALERLGDDVTVISAEPFRPVVSDEGVSTVYLPVSGAPYAPQAQLPMMRGLARMLREGGFDVVISGEVFQWATLTAARVAASAGPPLLVWHEADRYQRFGMTLAARAYYATFGRYIFRAATAVLPRSETSAEFLRANGLPDAKLGLELPNGFDESVFFPRRDLRRPEPRLLYVGSLIERKRPDLAVSALAEFRKTRPDATLRVKGCGALEAELRRLAADLGVQDSVEFDTTRSDSPGMAEIYNEAWVGVFPSERDFMSLSPMEAAACGVPVVVSNRLTHAGYVERIGIGEVAGNDPVQFAAAIARIVDARGGRGLSDEAVWQVREDNSLSRAAKRLHDYLAGQVERGGRDA